MPPAWKTATAGVGLSERSQASQLRAGERVEVDPTPLPRRLKGGVHHRLRFHPVGEARTAGAPLFDRLHELDVLVVAEGDERVAGAGVARGAGDLEELLRHRHAAQPGLAALADLDFVGAPE